MTLYEILYMYNPKHYDVYDYDTEIVVKLNNKTVATFRKKVGREYTHIQIAK